MVLVTYILLPVGCLIYTTWNESYRYRYQHQTNFNSIILNTGNTSLKGSYKHIFSFLFLAGIFCNIFLSIILGWGDEYPGGGCSVGPQGQQDHLLQRGRQGEQRDKSENLSPADSSWREFDASSFRGAELYYSLVVLWSRVPLLVVPGFPILVVQLLLHIQIYKKNQFKQIEFNKFSSLAK